MERRNLQHLSYEVKCTVGTGCTCTVVIKKSELLYIIHNSIGGQRSATDVAVFSHSVDLEPTAYSSTVPNLM